jgi:hypothetical protein
MVQAVKTTYKNLDGDSGIANYEIDGPAIIIEFVNAKERYVYDFSVPGEAHVASMKALADQGRGLATYISQHVKKNFARKIPLQS